MSVIGSNILAGASGQGGGYNLTNSLRFRSSASASLSRTPSSGSNRTTWTWSGWVKRAEITTTERTFFGAGTDGNNFTALAWINDSLYLQNYTSGTQTLTNTTAVYRDPSAWYHIVLAIDTTQGTAANRAKIYVNGVQQAGFSGTPFSSSQQFWINHTYTHRLGSRQLSSADSFSEQYMTEINFIDGQALTPSSFGETSATTGVWIPKKYTGTYGTNGFYLPFTNTASTSTLGNDFSGNSNTWTVNNISLTAGSTYDSMTDVPTLTSATAANYATINPLDYNSTYLTLNDGNLHQTYAGVVAAAASRATMVIPTTGKYYWEVYINATGGGSGERIRVGITRPTTAISGNSIDGSATSYLQMSNGQKRNNSTDSTYGSGFSATQIIQVLYDATAGAIYFGQNDSYANGSGSFNQTFSTATAAFTGLSGEFMPCFVTYGGADIAVNFGQRPFAYTPPTGFNRLNTFNLPTPTIGATASTQANDYFNVVTYTGNGSVGRAVTGVGFKPDFTWIKGRSDADYNYLVDIIRTYPNRLFSNLTDAASTESNTVTSSDSDGFTVGSDAGVNRNNSTYVAWNWIANGAGVTNTAGSITSTVSASTTAGFSIVTYTGTGSNATVGHGLGVAPSMYIVKRRSNTGNWYVYHISIGNTNRLRLDETSASTAESAAWNNTSPTSTVFSIGTSVDVNASTNTYVAYCFAQVAGYSAFGSYTGNGSTDGTFVFTGFRPKFVLIKRSDSAADWYLYDSARGSYNENKSSLYPNSSDAEGSSLAGHDFLSNGFKVRTSINSQNTNGGTYIYMAFAETPQKFALAR